MLFLMDVLLLSFPLSVNAVGVVNGGILKYAVI